MNLSCLELLIVSKWSCKELNLKKIVITDQVDEVEFLGFCIAEGFPQRLPGRWMASLYCSEFPYENVNDFQSKALGYVRTMKSNLLLIQYTVLL